MFKYHARDLLDLHWLDKAEEVKFGINPILEEIIFWAKKIEIKRVEIKGHSADLLFVDDYVNYPLHDPRD